MVKNGIGKASRDGNKKEGARTRREMYGRWNFRPPVPPYSSSPVVRVEDFNLRSLGIKFI